MKKLALVLIGAGGQAAAHPGPHLHPHDGASWLAVVAALGIVVVAGGLAVAQIRRRK